MDDSTSASGGWKYMLLFLVKLAAYLGGLVAFGFLIFWMRRSLH